MTEGFRINFSNIPGIPIKKQRRLKSRAPKDWLGIYNAFRRAGFSKEESTWAANHNCYPKDKRIRDILNHRKELVNWFLRTAEDQGAPITREEAKKKAEKDLTTKLEQRLIEDKNIFYEVSP